MFVVASERRSGPAGTAAVVRELEAWQERARSSVLLPFERTAAGRVQGVLASPAAAVDVALRLTRLGWAVGVGAGPGELPLGTSVAGSSGPAFRHAYDALASARSKAVPFPAVVHGEQDGSARSATTVLHLVGALRAGRSDAGWEVARRLATGQSQRDVAADLGITYQAVHDRVRVAGVREELAALPLVAELVGAAGGAGPGSATAPGAG